MQDVRSVPFRALFQPLSPDVLTATFRLRHSHVGQGRVRIALVSGGRKIRDWALRSTQQWRTYTLVVDDPGDLSYESLRLSATPLRAGTYQVQRGTVTVADPRYVYRAQYSFRTPADEAAAESIQRTGFEAPIYYDEADAANVHDEIASREEDAGATVTGLDGGVSLVDDLSGIARVVRTDRRAVLSDWHARIDKFPQ